MVGYEIYFLQSIHQIINLRYKKRKNSITLSTDCTLKIKFSKIIVDTF